MGPTRRLLAKPVLAAVEGYAVAGGMELALWCDLRIASESATFGIFCRRWGVPLIDGGTVRLPRIVGQGRALDLILTGRPVGAAEALAIGLANRVVPAGEARAEAERARRRDRPLPALCACAPTGARLMPAGTATLRRRPPGRGDRRRRAARARARATAPPASPAAAAAAAISRRFEPRPPIWRLRCRRSRQTERGNSTWNGCSCR